MSRLDGWLPVIVGAALLFVPIRILADYVEPVLLVIVLALIAIALILMELGWRGIRSAK